MAKNAKPKGPEVTDELIREIIGPSSDGSPNGRIFRKGEKKLISLLQKTDSTEYALRLINACIDYGIRIRFDERIQKLTGRLNKCSSIKAKEDLLAGELEDLQEEAWYWEEDGQSEPPHLSIEDESYWRRACEGVKLKRSNTRERILGWNLDQIRRGISSKIEGIINGEYYRISQEKIFELQDGIRGKLTNVEDQPQAKSTKKRKGVGVPFAKLYLFALNSEVSRLPGWEGLTRHGNKARNIETFIKAFSTELNKETIRNEIFRLDDKLPEDPNQYDDVFTYAIPSIINPELREKVRLIVEAQVKMLVEKRPKPMV